VSDRLRIGIDARELLGNATGVGRYLGELLRRWTARADASTREFVLYSPEPLEIRGITGRVVPGGCGTWWEQTKLAARARRDRLDAFFAPAYTAPVRLTVPLAVTIHDISFIAEPRWFRPRERWRRRLLTSYAARHAAVVFTDSEFSRGEIEKRLRVDRDRLVVIRPGVIEDGLKASTTEGRSASGPRSPLVLYVGTLLNRRRLPDLITAFARAARDVPDARLVIVGADRTWPKQDLRSVVESNNVSAKVDMREYIDQAELARLYAQASVFAFLSEYEGFGLTPLEALSAGVPIVVLDTPVAREVYGPAAIYVGRDVDATAAALQRLLLSPDTAASQLASAPAVLARYSWERAADATLDHIERIAKRSAAR
jgi:glycosyltransferase involved in cell wall biosynthesis